MEASFQRTLLPKQFCLERKEKEHGRLPHSLLKVERGKTMTTELQIITVETKGKKVQVDEL
jgi:hypothetical protein